MKQYKEVADKANRRVRKSFGSPELRLQGEQRAAKFVDVMGPTPTKSTESLGLETFLPSSEALTRHRLLACASHCDEFPARPGFD